MKIHRYYLLLALMLGSLGASFAQDSTKTKYIFKHGNAKIHHLGFYVAPEFRYGSLAGGFTPMAGASAMLLINKKFAIGFSGYGTVGRYTPSKISQNLNANFGGLKVEYTPNPNKAVHFTYGIMGGMGSARVDSANGGGGFGRGGFDRDGDRDGLGGSFGRFGRMGNGFGVIEPSIKIEANVCRFAKLFGGVSYRLTTGGSNIPTGLSNSDLMGVNISAGLKVGLFDLALKAKKKKV